MKEKRYYSIKEVAEMVSESEPTLRYWESEFPNHITPRRNEHGARFFTEKDIEDVRLIKHLLRNGKLKIEGAKKRLESRMDETKRNSKLLTHLQNIRKELKELQDAMDAAVTV
ncbi:MAG: MerR family transcriptional regulator [Tannerella sp.]|jgi:DNA-binding transcriptional MerR regulator|nr:MerR family transcriptional regulator [Tannerella sp.]